MRNFRSLVLVLAALASIHAEENAPENTWSSAVNGLRARLCFAEGFTTQGDLFPGVYLELENTTVVTNPIEFEFDAGKSIRFTLCTSDGKIIPEAADTYGGNGIIVRPYTLTIPHGGTLRFPVTWSGLGFPVNYGTILRFQNASWEIARDDRTAYFLSCTLEVLKAPGAATKSLRWSGSITTPSIRVPTAK